jgi:hypothetical protein
MGRAVLLRAAPGLFLLVAGTAVGAVAGAKSTVGVIAMGVATFGAILLVALAFYEVGRSEDRAREAERAHHDPNGARHR